MTALEQFNTLDEAAVEIAAARSYVYEAFQKDIVAIGWEHESEETRERWRGSIRVAVRSYVKAGGLATPMAERERNRAEIERLHRADEKRVKDISRLITERDEARDEIERLRAKLVRVNEKIDDMLVAMNAEERREAAKKARATLIGGEA